METAEGLKEEQLPMCEQLAAFRGLSEVELGKDYQLPTKHLCMQKKELIQFIDEHQDSIKQYIKICDIQKRIYGARDPAHQIKFTDVQFTMQQEGGAFGEAPGEQQPLTRVKCHRQGDPSAVVYTFTLASRIKHQAANANIHVFIDDNNQMYILSREGQPLTQGQLFFKDIVFMKLTIEDELILLDKEGNLRILRLDEQTEVLSLEIFYLLEDAYDEMEDKRQSILENIFYLQNSNILLILLNPSKSYLYQSNISSWEVMPEGLSRLIFALVADQITDFEHFITSYEEEIFQFSDFGFDELIDMVVDLNRYDQLCRVCCSLAKIWIENNIQDNVVKMFTTTILSYRSFIEAHETLLAFQKKIFSTHPEILEIILAEQQQQQ